MDWAAPDAAAPRPAPAARPPAPGPGRRDGPTRPLPSLAPMTASDVLDGAFQILKAAPATIIAFTAVFAVPVQVLAGWLQRDLLSGGFAELLEESDTSLTALESGGDGSAWASMVLLFGPSLALVFVAAGLARLVGAWHVGRDLTLGELLRGSLGMAWPLLASWALVHLAEAVGLLLCGLPALAVMTWFLVTAPVIGAEGLGPVAAMRRSARLAARRFFPVMGLALLSGAVAYLFSQALGLLPSVIALVIGTDGVGWVLLAASGALTSLITMPVVAGATVLIYLDLRVRTEGLDLELEALDAFPPPASPTTA